MKQSYLSLGIGDPSIEMGIGAWAENPEGWGWSAGADGQHGGSVIMTRSVENGSRCVGNGLKAETSMGWSVAGAIPSCWMKTWTNERGTKS